MKTFDRASFGCCPSGRILSDDYGIPTCSSNDVTRSVEHCAYQSCKSLKTDANSCTKRRECLPFKITWAQISSRDARFIFSLQAGAVVRPLLPDTDTFRRCFDFFMIRWSRQNRPLAKKDVRWYALVVKIHHGTIILIHGTMWVIWRYRPYHWMCFKF